METSAAEPTETAAGMACELMDLLTVIRGHAEILDLTLPEPDFRRDDVDAIVAAAERAGRLGSRLLSISRHPDDVA